MAIEKSENDAYICRAVAIDGDAPGTDSSKVAYRLSGDDFGSKFSMHMGLVRILESLLMSLGLLVQSSFFFLQHVLQRSILFYPTLYNLRSKNTTAYLLFIFIS